MKTFTQILKEAFAGQSVNSADRKPVNYMGPDGKMHTKLVPAKRNLTKEEADYDEWNEMTRTELRAAINAAEEILEMMDEGVELERWQLSEIVTASKSLTDVYINMSADNEIE